MATEDLDHYYDSLRSMFSSEGWKYFIEDYKESYDSLKNISHMDCPTNDLWQVRRGQIQQLENIINFEEFILKADEQRQEESKYASV